MSDNPEQYDTFNISFKDTENNEVGKLIIEKDKPMRFEGDMEESAETFFKHLKSRIDNYLKNQS